VSEKRFVIRGGLIFDGTGGDPYEGDILVEGNRIIDLAQRPEQLAADGAEVISAHDCTVIPGLIDAHVHIAAIDVHIQSQYRNYFTSELALRMAGKLRELLDQGFTSARDAGGADAGFVRAIEAGVIPGPRLLISGRPVSQTGGHGDVRKPWEDTGSCGCGAAVGMLHAVADGADEVRRTVRTQLRRGARQIKIMASGGAMSPTDRMESTQYSVPELRAAVEEAQAVGTYVLAHAYTPAAIRRCVEAGVACIEHANMIDAETAALLAAEGIAVTPTIVTYEQLYEYGDRHGVPSENLAKIEQAYNASFEGLRLLHEAGASIGLGSDLLGDQSAARLRSLTLQSKVIGTRRALVSATATNARHLGISHLTGTLERGKAADITVVRGNILDDLSLILKNGAIDTVAADGVLVKKGGRLLV
jgi:imidazolonepropionase-like amidohydrolase